ncbi:MULTISPECIES: hypothetical protein [Flavobacterium]|uniref:hypothetical protein n=1 Tax=Flavobacterium TaxID=237 RepID=UPI001FCA5ACF|nr:MULTISPECIES: hypothetical protein [Flavobacterium]UOK43354.1 hypothetical protein LZF87_04340 [Flavobacterium enshiense]
MEQIEQLYHNDFGVAFYWIRNDKVLREKVQLVFKETGFYLSFSELMRFSANIETTCINIKCSDCKLREHCHKFLLETPFPGLELAVSESEAIQLKDLVSGTLFQVELDNYLNNLCKN